MNIFSSLSIKTRLILLVSVSLTIIVGVSALGLNSMSHSKDSIEELYKGGIEQTNRIADIFDHLATARTHVLLSLQHAPSNEFESMHNHSVGLHIDNIKSYLTVVEKQTAALMNSNLTSTERALANELLQAKNIAVSEGFNPAISAIRSGNYFKANELLLTVINPAFDKADAASEHLLEMQIDEAKAAFEQSQVDFNTLSTWFITLLIIGIGLCGTMAYITIRGISLGVTKLSNAANALANGNLNAQISDTSTDEIGLIANAFNTVANKFRATIVEISDSINQLASAANQTSAITTQTTQGIQRQRSEIEMVASATTEMNTTVHEVAQNASQASEAAGLADESSNKGKLIVNETITAIKRLAEEVENASDIIHTVEQGSVSIGSVLNVIRGIAEQTNLLALNAAIEAARAGEQGRGFAVVADEVRTLASRTQQSTEEIQEMIEQLQSSAKNAVQAMVSGQNKAQAGVAQAEQAGKALDDITHAVDQINLMNSQIATAAEEQSSVTDEINRNISSISEVSEQTSSGAEQTSAASEDLARLAEKVKMTTDQFVI